MKKIILCLMATGLSLTLLPLQSNAAIVTTAATDSLVVSGPAESAEPKAVLQGLNETTTMDRSNLNSSDKKNTQQIEVRSDRQDYGRHHHHGVYLTVGGLLLIILILVILL